MGQNTSGQNSPSNVTQRIRPTPGTSGRRLRKGSVSIYCEKSHSIFTVTTKPGMTVQSLKKMLPNKNCELKIAEKPLPNSALLDSLPIDNTTLIRMLSLEVPCQKSISTTDSIPEQEMPKIIGPKRQLIERPQKPNHESVCSVGEENSTINLKLYAVPDLKLEKSYTASIRKPLR